MVQPLRGGRPRALKGNKSTFKPGGYTPEAVAPGAVDADE